MVLFCMLLVENAKKEIEKKLNSDLEQIANWLVKNNLVVNIKQSKTECVLYGTQQKTAESKPKEIIMNQTKIIVSDVYKYLGVKMNRSLTFNEHLERNIKRASTKVQLLSRIRHNITPAVEALY